MRGGSFSCRDGSASLLFSKEIPNGNKNHNLHTTPLFCLYACQLHCSNDVGRRYIHYVNVSRTELLSKIVPMGKLWLVQRYQIRQRIKCRLTVLNDCTLQNRYSIPAPVD